MPLTFKQTILACVDGATYSQAVRDFGVLFAKTTQTPLTLFNTIENPKTGENADLSGNITLGGRDDLLDALVEEERAKSKALINTGRVMLERLKEGIEEGIEVASLQRHGSLYENVQDLEAQTRMLILGLSGQDHEGQERVVGEQVEEVIRSLHVPILLVNTPFKEPRKVMIAYDGSRSAKKALETVSQTPLLKAVERHIVCVESSIKKAQETLESAKPLMAGVEGKVHFVALEGEAVESLLGYQAKENMELIAMGAFSHNRLRDKLFGSFTAKMIARAGVPLLLLR